MHPFHFIGHLNSVKPQLTVEENCAFWCRLLSSDGAGSGLEERVEDALAAVDLINLAGSPAQFLSQGQSRRLALARLVAAPRPIWLWTSRWPASMLPRVPRSPASWSAISLAAGFILAATHEPLGLAGAAALPLAPA